MSAIETTAYYHFYGDLSHQLRNEMADQKNCLAALAMQKLPLFYLNFQFLFS